MSEHNNTVTPPATAVTALILAASRTGAADSVAQIQDKSHKCLIKLNGTTMIERVVKALVNTGSVNRIFASVEDPELLREVPQLADWLDDGTVKLISSKGNLDESIAAAAKHTPDPYPLIITAADNALHTAEMLEHFCVAVSQGDADAYIAMTRAQLILDKYPEGARAFHQLKDDAYSSCNLYGVTSNAGLNGARPFATGGQFGKKPWRIAKGFGLMSLILYKLRLLTLEGVSARISRRVKAKVRVVIMPWAEAPIDVDNPEDYELVTKILEKQEGKFSAG